MKAKAEYRDRPETEVAVLDALADRADDGMTVLELRSRVDTDIDRLQQALEALKADDLIEVTSDSDRTLITPESGVVGAYEPDTDESMIDAIRRRLPL